MPKDEKKKPKVEIDVEPDAVPPKCPCGETMQDLQSFPDEKCSPEALEKKEGGWKWWCRCGRFVIG